MVKPSVKMTEFKHHSMYFQKALHVDSPFYGIQPLYQRAEVAMPGADCETVGDFTAEGTDFTVAAVGSGRVGANSIRLTQVDADQDESVYLLLSGPVDLRWVKKIGFWYKAGNGDIFASGDIRIYFFTRGTEYLYTNATIHHALPAYTETNPAVWHYCELTLANFTVASGKGNRSLKEVWGLGFYSDKGTDTNYLDVDQIEFYIYGTGYGPARGRIMSAPILDGTTITAGQGVAWEPFSGRLKVSAVDDDDFAGIALLTGTGNEAGTVRIPFIVDGIVNMLCNDASIALDEGVSLSAAGTGTKIDDGGGASQGLMIGKSLDTGATDKVIPIMLGMPGTSA